MFDITTDKFHFNMLIPSYQNRIGPYNNILQHYAIIYYGYYGHCDITVTKVHYCSSHMPNKTNE